MKGKKETLNYYIVRITSDRIDVPLIDPINTVEDIFNWAWYEITNTIHEFIYGHFVLILAQVRSKENCPDLPFAFNITSELEWRLKSWEMLQFI